MKTDAEALAHYFENWRKGMPLPGGWERIGDGSWTKPIRIDHRWARLRPTEAEHIDTQALTSVLVVEMAKKGLELSHYICPEYGPSGADWRVADDSVVGGFQVEGCTPLCALVASFLEVWDG